MRFWAALAVSVLIPAFASEAGQHYRSWTSSDAPSQASAQRQQDFVDKLKGLIDEAERRVPSTPNSSVTSGGWRGSTTSPGGGWFFPTASKTAISPITPPGPSPRAAIGWSAAGG